MLIQPEPGLVIWTIVTFLLLLFVLGRYAWKPLLAMLEERERTIQEALDQAKEARDESEQLLEKNRAILADARNQLVACCPIVGLDPEGDVSIGLYARRADTGAIDHEPLVPEREKEWRQPRARVDFALLNGLPEDQ